MYHEQALNAILWE